jgi:CRP-like cAMP-binding protein
LEEILIKPFLSGQTMVKESVLKNVFKHVALNQHEADYFLSQLIYKKVGAKTIILREGERCQYLYYVDSGALRAYCVDSKGRESTIMFAIRDWWVTDMYCFLNNKPAMMFIETIADSNIYQVSKTSLEELFLKVPKFERFFRILMQNAYTREQLRVIENLSLPAAERYENFLKKYPNIAGMVTQKQIASYLGVTPEFLSAIRKERSVKRIS